MKIELKKAGISLKDFAKIVQINRNYFASLINTPIKWETCTKIQRNVYLAMNAWIEYRKNPSNLEGKNSNFHAAISRTALKPINGNKSGAATGVISKNARKQKRFVK